MNRRSSLKLLASSGMSYGLMTSFSPLSLGVSEKSAEAAFLESFARVVLGDYYKNPQASLKKGAFIHCFIEQCWNKEDHQLFWGSAAKLQDYCQKKYQLTFEKLSDAEQQKITTLLFDSKKHLFEEDNEWAVLTRQLVLFEFFSGQKGATEALRHLPLPGRYEGNIPLLPTDTLFRH